MRSIVPAPDAEGLILGLVALTLIVAESVAAATGGGTAALPV